jgi:hypothetical protein
MSRALCSSLRVSTSSNSRAPCSPGASTTRCPVPEPSRVHPLPLVRSVGRRTDSEQGSYLANRPIAFSLTFTSNGSARGGVAVI